MRFKWNWKQQKSNKTGDKRIQNKLKKIILIFPAICRWIEPSTAEERGGNGRNQWEGGGFNTQQKLCQGRVSAGIHVRPVRHRPLLGEEDKAQMPLMVSVTFGSTETPIPPPRGWWNRQCSGRAKRRGRGCGNPKGRTVPGKWRRGRWESPLGVYRLCVARHPRGTWLWLKIDHQSELALGALTSVLADSWHPTLLVPHLPYQKIRVKRKMNER